MSSPASEQQNQGEEELYHSTLARFLRHPSYIEALIAFGLFVQGEREYEQSEGRLTAGRRADYHKHAIQQLDLYSTRQEKRYCRFITSGSPGISRVSQTPSKQRQRRLLRVSNKRRHLATSVGAGWVFWKDFWAP
jgi:hypothetical protein